MGDVAVCAGQSVELKGTTGTRPVFPRQTCPVECFRFILSGLVSQNWWVVTTWQGKLRKKKPSIGIRKDIGK